MGIESPKIEKLRKEVEEMEGEDRLKAMERIKKKAREILAWGFIAISSLGAAKALKPLLPDEFFEKGVSLEQVLKSDIRRDRELNTAERRELWGKINYLKEQFGESVLLRLKVCADHNKEVELGPPEINGFEKLHSGLDSKSLRHIWNEKYYPQGWINERIKEIEYVDKTEEIGDKYGLDPEEWKAAASYDRKLEKKEAKVSFFRPSGSLSEDVSAKNVVNVLDHYFGHEIGHANDWEEEDLDFKNRVEFLYEVTRHYSQKGSFRDAGKYVESIKNEDPETERYCKVIEYWGEACEYYFSLPGDFQKAWPSEFDLVDRYVKKEDPTFDSFEKKEQRNELIEKMVEKK